MTGGNSPVTPPCPPPSTLETTIVVPAGNGDGVYGVGKFTKDSKFLRVSKEMEGDYRRYTLEGGNIIVFRKV